MREFYSRLVAVPLALLTVLSGSSVSPVDNRGKLFKNSRAVLARARARGEDTAVLLVVARPGANPKVAKEISGLGGSIRYRADKVDYLRAKVPIGIVEAVAKLEGIEAVDLDGSDDTIYPPPKEQPSSSPPDPETPLSHPHLPIKDIGGEEFLAAHPTFDGRGVGFALIDGTPDLLHPEFQSAKSLDGKEVPKVVDVLAATDPRDDRDPMWVNMKTEVNAEAGRFTYEGNTYTVPADGHYRFGFFDERALNEPVYLYKDVNFDGNPEGSSGLFGVLWNEATNTVWVDTNQDRSFNDEKPLTDYARHRDLGVFGKEKPEAAPRKSVAFAVQTDTVNKYVRISLAVWQHATAVAGASVGKGFYHGMYKAIAGEAQLISILPRGMHGVVEAALLAAKHPKVDVICIEPTAGIPELYALRDARLATSVVLDRIVEKYGKPILSPAGNARGLTSIHDYTVAQHLLSVGAYQSQDNFRINYGAEVEHKDNLHFVGSYGPGGNGALKPDLISPSAVISTDSGFKPAQKRKGQWELPPGYTIAGGTSTAGPTAAAACALLISAAKQSHVRYDPDRLKRALIGGARFIPHIPAYQQGNGLIQLGPSWDLLRQMDSNYEPIAIESRAPVRTEGAEYLTAPNEGVGLWEREGWRLGMEATRTITFTRTSGRAEPITFPIQWVGNDGSFESPHSITLPLNKPISLAIHIKAKEPGAHSAILNLLWEGSRVIAYQVLNTIVAAEELAESNHFSLISRVTVPRPSSRSLFFRVPADSPNLRVEIQAAPASPRLMVQLHAPIGPSERRFDFLGRTEKGRLSKTVERPETGVWEVVLNNMNFAFAPEEVDSRPLSSTPVTVIAAVLGSETAPKDWKVDPTVMKASQEFTVRNRWASFFGGAVLSALGSCQSAHRKIRDGDQHVYEVEVPPGAERLATGITSDSQDAGDLDLYIFEPGQSAVAPTAQSTGKSAREWASVDAPKPGRWHIVVDAFRVPGGEMDYSYEDCFTHSALGTAAVDDTPALRTSGAKWKISVTMTVTAMPVNGRYLEGFVPVSILKDSDYASNETNQKPQTEAAMIGAARIRKGNSQ